MSQTGSRNANGFTTAAVACFVAAASIVILYYAVHPGLRKLAARRERILEANPQAPSDGARVGAWRGWLGPKQKRQSRGLEAAPGQLVIRRAIYGDFVNLGGSVDVTAAVSALAHSGQLDFVVSNSILGGDPVPDVKKTLKIEYQLGGGRKSQQWDEGVRVVLPSPEQPG